VKTNLRGGANLIFICVDLSTDAASAISSINYWIDYLKNGLF
jgi:hypothetical protein